MKKINFLALATIVTLVFSSCSSEESQITDDQNLKSLKTYQIKRDATGAYSVDFDVTDNVKVDKVFNKAENNNQFFLYSSDNQKSSRSISEDISIDNKQVKIGFVDTQNNSSPTISIIDDNIHFSKKSNDTKLSTYSITSNEDGSFGLDFTVKQGVTVDFIYNEETSTYEAHLEDGNASESNFSRILEKENGKLLKIDFVNHISNANAKSMAESFIRKPKIIVDSGNDD